MEKKFLPVGTVVLLEGATKKLVITGYCSATSEEPERIYDYVAYLFPEANLAGEDVALFDHDQIETIVHMGLIDDEFSAFEKIINDSSTSEEATIIADLPPFNVQNVRQTLESLKRQNMEQQIVSEPTAFSDKVMRKPVFDVPSINQKKDYGTKFSSVNSENEDEDDLPAGDGKPVLQLELINLDDSVFIKENFPKIVPNNSMSELTHL